MPRAQATRSINRESTKVELSSNDQGAHKLSEPFSFNYNDAVTMFDDDDYEDPKAFLTRQHKIRPFYLDNLHQKCLAEALEANGFGSVTFLQVEPHPVYAYRGRIGTSGCATSGLIRRSFKKLLKSLGFKISLSDILVTVRSERFQAVVQISD